MAEIYNISEVKLENSLEEDISKEIRNNFLNILKDIKIDDEETFEQLIQGSDEVALLDEEIDQLKDNLKASFEEVLFSGSVKEAFEIKQQRISDLSEKFNEIKSLHPKFRPYLDDLVEKALESDVLSDGEKLKLIVLAKQYLNITPQQKSLGSLSKTTGFLEDASSNYTLSKRHQVDNDLISDDDLEELKKIFSISIDSALLKNRKYIFRELKEKLEIDESLEIDIDPNILGEAMTVFITDEILPRWKEERMLCENKIDLSTKGKIIECLMIEIIRLYKVFNNKFIFPTSTLDDRKGTDVVIDFGDVQLGLDITYTNDKDRIFKKMHRLEKKNPCPIYKSPKGFHKKTPLKIIRMPLEIDEGAVLGMMKNILDDYMKLLDLGAIKSYQEFQRVVVRDMSFPTIAEDLLFLLDRVDCNSETANSIDKLRKLFLDEVDKEAKKRAKLSAFA